MKDLPGKIDKNGQLLQGDQGPVCLCVKINVGLVETKTHLIQQMSGGGAYHGPPIGMLAFFVRVHILFWMQNRLPDANFSKTVKIRLDEDLT